MNVGDVVGFMGEMRGAKVIRGASRHEKARKAKMKRGKSVSGKKEIK